VVASTAPELGSGMRRLLKFKAQFRFAQNFVQRRRELRNADHKMTFKLRHLSWQE
jgi:hypothetical protein